MGLKYERFRKFLLWFSGFQMTLHAIVTIGFIVLDVEVRNCKQDCLVDVIHTEILEFLHVVPFFLAVFLFVGIYRNDLPLIRIWLIIVMVATIIIFSVQIAIFIYYVKQGLNYEIWFMYIPLFIEMVVLTLLIAYVYQYYNNHKQPTTEISFQDNTSPDEHVEKGTNVQ